MARGVTAAAIALVLLAAGAGCGGHSNAKAVGRYIDHVNLIRRGLTVPLADVSARYRDLNTGSSLGTMQPDLEKSARTIRSYERRLDSLQPPPEAQRLDRLLRQLVHEQWQLANELAQASGYIRAAGPVLTRASAAGRRLRSVLRAAKTRSAEAAALEDYAVPLDAAVRELRKLNAPPLVRPTQTSEVATYVAVAHDARALAAALRAHKSGVAELHALQVAVASGSTITAQRARIAAIKAFNGRVAHLTRLDGQIQRERDRLQRTLS